MRPWEESQYFVSAGTRAPSACNPPECVRICRACLKLADSGTCDVLHPGLKGMQIRTAHSTGARTDLIIDMGTLCRPGADSSFPSSRKPKPASAKPHRPFPPMQKESSRFELKRTPQHGRLGLLTPVSKTAARHVPGNSGFSESALESKAARALSLFAVSARTQIAATASHNAARFLRASIRGALPGHERRP